MGVIARVVLQRYRLGLPLSLWAAPVGRTGLRSLVILGTRLCLGGSR